MEHFKEGGHKMICPGRQKDAPLTFAQVAEKAQKFHGEGKFIAALPYYGAMLELTERALGLFHFQCANILEAMCTCYEKAEKFEKATHCLQRVIVLKEVMSDNSVEKNREVFYVMGRLAEMYLTMNYIDLAKQMLLKMEESAKETFGENSFERGRALCSLAGCYERSDELAEAEKTLLQCLELEEYMHPSEKSKLNATSIAFYNLAMIYFSQKKMSEAKSKFETALKLKREAGASPDDADVVDCQNMIDSCVSSD